MKVLLMCGTVLDKAYKQFILYFINFHFAICLRLVSRDILETKQFFYLIKRQIATYSHPFNPSILKKCAFTVIRNTVMRVLRICKLFSMLRNFINTLFRPV